MVFQSLPLVFTPNPEFDCAQGSAAWGLEVGTPLAHSPYPTVHKAEDVALYDGEAAQDGDGKGARDGHTAATFRHVEPWPHPPTYSPPPLPKPSKTPGVDTPFLQGRSPRFLFVTSRPHPCPQRPRCPCSRLAPFTTRLARGCLGLLGQSKVTVLAALALAIVASSAIALTAALISAWTE